jgi:hypothetical protein
MPLLPLTADARPVVSTQYGGHLVGSPDVRSISLNVTTVRQNNTRAKFTVKGLPLLCEGGSREQTFGPTHFKFVGAAVFHGQRYVRLGDGNWSYYEVKGRMLRGGRAKGYVYYLMDSYGPAEEARPDCNTGGQLYYPWRAKRVRR